MRPRARVACSVGASLVMCFGAEAAVFTAGVGGTYPTIQAAINAAVAAGGDNMVKVRASTFDESLIISSAMTSGSLTISGGWSTLFLSRNPDPSSTVVHPTNGSPAISLGHGGGTVRFDGMTFTADHPTGYGGAVHAQLSGTAQLFFDHCVISGSSADGRGGGAYLYLTQSAHVELWDCVVSNNTALSPTGAAGGGLYIYLNMPTTSGRISWSTIENNSLQTAGSSSTQGAGISVQMYGGHLEISDCTFSDNSLGSASGDRIGAELYLEMYGFGSTTTAELRRNRFHSSPSISGSDTVHVFANSDVEVDIRDSWFSGGAGAGIAAEYYNAGTLTINNTTVTDFAGTSIDVAGDGNQDLVSLTNSILWGNGTDTPSLPTGSASWGNLVSVDPLFVDPAGRNYRLQAGSPAIDTSSGSPVGGFSDTDLHGLDRLIGPAVDAGGSEWGGLFADGFEVGTTRMWSSEG